MTAYSVDAISGTCALRDQHRSGVRAITPLWGDRIFKVLDPNGYEIWFYTNVAEPKPPQGAKLV